MAVSWSELQKVVVIAALEEFGVMSARCERAAARILPPARELDPTSVPRRCLPNYGRFVCPKRRWFYHVNVFVEQHYVDALSGPDGLEEEAYLQQHWAERDAIFWEDLSTDELERLCA